MHKLDDELLTGSDLHGLEKRALVGERAAVIQLISEYRRFRQGVDSARGVEPKDGE